MHARLSFQKVENNYYYYVHNDANIDMLGLLLSSVDNQGTNPEVFLPESFFVFDQSIWRHLF